MDFRPLGSEVKWGATICRPKCQGWCCKRLWVAIPWAFDLLVLSFHLFSCEKGDSPAPPRAKHASQRTMLLIQPHLDLGGDLWPWAWSSNKENEAIKSIKAKLFGIQNDLLQNAARKYIACLFLHVRWDKCYLEMFMVLFFSKKQLEKPLRVAAIQPRDGCEHCPAMTSKTSWLPLMQTRRIRWNSILSQERSDVASFFKDFLKIETNL